VVLLKTCSCSGTASSPRNTRSSLVGTAIAVSSQKDAARKIRSCVRCLTLAREDNQFRTMAATTRNRETLAREPLTT